MFDEDPEESLGPDVPDGSDAPQELRLQFWLLVGAFNVAIFAASLGVMLVGFRGQWILGGSVAFAGLALFFYGVKSVRRRQRPGA